MMGIIADAFDWNKSEKDIPDVISSGRKVRVRCRYHSVSF
jgi:hypothetical protein